MDLVDMVRVGGLKGFVHNIGLYECKDRFARTNMNDIFLNNNSGSGTQGANGCYIFGELFLNGGGRVEERAGRGRWELLVGCHRWNLWLDSTAPFLEVTK